MSERARLIDSGWNAVYPVIARYVPAEAAHDATINVLKQIQEHPFLLKLLREILSPVQDERLRTEIITPHRILSFDNPIGIAAGMDKNIEAVVAFILGLNAGGVEGGTLTLQPQPGNEGKRLERVLYDKALLNRMGFNNVGLDIGVQNLQKQKDLFQSYDSRNESMRTPVIGVNIGPNKTTVESGDMYAVTHEYVMLMDALAQFADYFVLNISSPNTPGLRSFQEVGHLTSLLATVMEKRDQIYAELGIYVPCMVKLSPDENSSTFINALRLMQQAGADGVVLTNTTIRRPLEYTPKDRQFKGGLSGPPIFYPALNWVTLAHQYLSQDTQKPQIPIIGVGGIDSAADIIRMVLAGASHTQIYTGLVYGGPGFLNNTLSELSRFMDAAQEQTGVSRISELVGQYHNDEIRQVYKAFFSQ